MSNSPSNKDSTSAEGRSLRRRQKCEAHLTSGCGFGKSKKRLIDGFWASMWPGLEELGWTKVDGKGLKQGSVYFIPKGINMKDEKTELGEDYYDRLRDVVDRVCADDAILAETIVADEFMKDMEELDALQGDETLPKSSRRPDAKPSAQLDLSWKDGGSTYPKASSRVGERYQAPAIPEAGTFSTQETHEDPDLQYDQIWDPKRAEAAGVLNFVQDSVKRSRREAAIAALHAKDYKTEKLQEVISEAKITDGSDWTKEEKEKYHSEMFRLRKSIVDVAKSTGFGNNSTYAYYLSKFKKSDDYRLLKTICEEERLHKFAASDQGLDACGICGDGGSLLICDGCEGEYHMTCLRPPLVNIPEGTWHCDSCVDSKFLESRDTVIEKFYVEIGDTSKKRKADAMEGARASPKPKNKDTCDIVLRPSEPVLKAVKALASCITQALTPS